MGGGFHREQQQEDFFWRKWHLEVCTHKLCFSSTEKFSRAAATEEEGGRGGLKGPSHPLVMMNEGGGGSLLCHEGRGPPFFQDCHVGEGE